MNAAKHLFFFRSEDGLCPDIPIVRREEMMLGRGPLTRIKDSKLSRQQLKILWNDSGVFATQYGDNSSFINGRPFIKGEKVELQDGDRIHLVSNNYPFRFFFKTDAIAHPPSSGTSVSNFLAKQDELDKSEDRKPIKRNSSGEIKSSPSTVTQKKEAKTGHWNLGLLASMNDPELKVKETETVVIIKDKYPKAQHHYLVLPKERLSNLESLRPEHIPLVEVLASEGRQLVQQHDTEFRLGFHAIPSMSQVHLHVISQDFVSPCLKTKKHWNSFTTPYFINPEEVLDKLKNRGRYTAPSSEQAKKWLNRSLICHKCDLEVTNMPRLKDHLLTHLK